MNHKNIIFYLIKHTIKPLQYFTFKLLLDNIRLKKNKQFYITIIQDHLLYQNLACSSQLRCQDLSHGVYMKVEKYREYFGEHHRKLEFCSRFCEDLKLRYIDNLDLYLLVSCHYVSMILLLWLLALVANPVLVWAPINELPSH